MIETEGVGLIEQNWMGETLRMGQDVMLKITDPTERCVMTNFAQPTIPEDNSIFACIGRETDFNFGVYAKVIVGGEVNCDEKVEII